MRWQYSLFHRCWAWIRSFWYYCQRHSDHTRHQCCRLYGRQPLFPRHKYCSWRHIDCHTRGHQLHVLHRKDCMYHRNCCHTGVHCVQSHIYYTHHRIHHHMHVRQPYVLHHKYYRWYHSCLRMCGRLFLFLLKDCMCHHIHYQMHVTWCCFLCGHNRHTLCRNHL